MTPIKRSDIENMIISLFPTGRAWDFIRGNKKIAGDAEYYVDGNGVYYVDGNGVNYISRGQINGDFNAAFFEVICDIFQDEYASTLNILSQKFPDNPYFTADDAENHERVFGITPSEGSTLDQRKQVILARMSNDRNNEYQATRSYLEKVLRDSGFDVYVHENRFPSESVPAQAGTAISGIDTVGGGVISDYPFEAIYPDGSYTQICANNIRPEDDADFFEPVRGTSCGYAESGVDTFGTDDEVDIYKTLPYIIFIGGATYPNPADIPASRIREFRDLILKSKETHILALLYVNLT